MSGSLLEHRSSWLATTLAALCGAGVMLVGVGCAGLGDPSPQTGRRVPVVMWFDHHREVLQGHAIGYGDLRPSTLDVSSRISRLRCVGTTRARIVPIDAEPPTECEGIRGAAELSCSDGRQIQIAWAEEDGCDKGFGEGRDAQGNTLRLVFGGSDQRADAVAEDALSGGGELPDLPPLGAASGEEGQATGVSTGTAFFVTWEGHLITNHHVVRGASRVQVQLADGEFLDADVLQLDEENDLALLHVDAIRRPLAVEEEPRLVRGQEVFTLGYPLIQLQGQEQKATFGHVNSTTGMQGDDRFAQIDVPIQPGNSGAPLSDREGDVVGVVTSMLHPRITYEVAGVVPQNVNYAVKSHFVHAVMRRELTEGWVSERWPDKERGFSELASEAEKSVVLVMAW